jgi:glycerol-3-phosphate dehydrogenase
VGATARDIRTGGAFEVRARHVINATGVWADQLVEGICLRPSKGSHVLVRADRLGNPDASVNVPVPGHFGRFVFAVPRTDDLVMIGLTDDPYDGPIPDIPTPTAEDERFLLETVSRALGTILDRSDVVGRYAGLRPLLAAEGETSDISRRHAVIEDPATAAITVVGGKLTTYRQMAEDAVDAVTARPGVDAARCRTATLPLVGARRPTGQSVTDRTVNGRLLRRFGAEADEVAAAADDRPELLEPIAPGLPAYGVEFVAAVEREGALSADDVLDVRTRLGLVPEWRDAALPAAQELFSAAPVTA